MTFRVEAIVAGEDTVLAALAGDLREQTPPFMGWPATGRQVEIDVFDVIRFAGGRAVEHWGVADRLGLPEQLGLTNEGARPAP